MCIRDRPEGVPYVSNSQRSTLVQDSSHYKGVNDDIFDMINEATSKSMSSSPSHLHNLLQHLPTSTGAAIDLNPQPALRSRNPGSISVDPTFTQQQQPMLPPSLGLSHQAMPNNWDTIGSFFQNSSNTQQGLECQNQQQQSGQPRQNFSPFHSAVDPKNSYTEDLNSLSDFLSSTRLQVVETGMVLSLSLIHI